MATLSGCEGRAERLERDDDGGAIEPVADAGVDGVDGGVADAGGADAGVDAGGVDGGVADAGTIDAGSSPARVPVFVAHGQVARTLISCDDGRSWVHDRSDDPSLNCSMVDCGHHSGAAHGLVFTGEWFVANYGWGAPGSVRRSRDGIEWQTVATTMTGGGGLASLGTQLLWVAFVDFSISANQGTSWSSLNDTVGYFLSRNVASTETTAIVTGDSTDVAKITHNAGATWSDWSVPHVDLSGRNLQLASNGRGLFVAVTSRFYYDAATGTGVNHAYVLRSTDFGATWSGKEVATGGLYQVWSTLLFDGAHFVTWFEGQRWSSTDGDAWVQTPVDAPAELGAVARSARGTYVSISPLSYASQSALRSDDGVHWVRLAPSAFVGGHPVTSIVAGDAPQAACR